MSRLQLRIFLSTTRLGPGKADLLEQIAATGSISAAGRAMGMSYKRAWSLVEEMNAAFSSPLVLSARGGSGGGGASLSETGERVLTLYREALAAAELAVVPAVSRLETMLAEGMDGASVDISEQK